MLHNHCFGDDPPGVAHEIFQQRKFEGLQVYFPAASENFAGVQV